MLACVPQATDLQGPVKMRGVNRAAPRKRSRSLFCWHKEAGIAHLKRTKDLLLEIVFEAHSAQFFDQAARPVDASAVLPLLPEFAGMLTCTRLFSVVEVLPIKKSRLRVLEPSVFLNSISVITDPLVAPVKSRVAVLAVRPDASFTAT